VVTSLQTAAATLADAGPGPASHANGMTWWVVALVTVAAIGALGVVITLMTLAERKRHPHAEG
jgi:hypothetical protein